jgi:hypothetical protein
MFFFYKLIVENVLHENSCFMHSKPFLKNLITMQRMEKETLEQTKSKLVYIITP